MGYYVRVLSTSADYVQLSALQAALEENKLQATLSSDEGGSEDWTQLILSHSDGQEIASIERNLVETGSLGCDELAEFAAEVADCKPVNAAKWLLNYFHRIRCIYTFQVLSGADHKNGWDIVGTVKNCIWSFAPSILQADNEGFSNEEGYHILWQFSDSADGNWWMGVLSGSQWSYFQMNLGNRKHRESFFQGKIPDGVKRADLCEPSP
jgi:hypothetical protein